MFNKRILIYVFVCILALISVFSGCTPKDIDKTPGSNTTNDGGETTLEQQEPITLTFFDKNTSDSFDNSVALKIIEETGISIEIQQPTGNPEEKLSLMLTSADLPDIVLMDRRSEIVNKYIAAEALIPLNDLLEEYGPDILEMYGDVLTKSRYEDGQNYYLNNWYGVDPDPDRGINMRMDLLVEFGYGDKAMNGEYFTQDEFVDILTQFKEKYTEINGQPAIPFTLNGEYMETALSIFKGMYGLKRYYEKSDGELQLIVKDPKYLEMVKFVNQLYRDDLLDPEWAINKKQIFAEKLVSGSVVAAGGGHPSDVNNIFYEDEGKDTNKQFYMFRVVAPGVDPEATTFSPRSSLGWDAIGITATNEHPIETIKFMNYLASEEGQYLLMWGVEGEHWDYEDGVHTPNPDIIPGFKNDWGEYSKTTGIRKWSWFVKNGYGSDGTPFDLVGKYEKDAVGQHAHISMVGSVWDTAPYDSVGPLGGTPEALVEQKLRDIMDQGFANMAYAESVEELEKEYQEMLDELEANQASVVEAIYTENYRAQLVLWN